ncbi:hypothetical protein GCM10008983_25790 [Lentibacillus halophilus]|uniref:Double zinc ribbon n=1 Tax=Lentibacillus halophilus TaxID=295065 RepID=A0ABP3J9Y5_9BACI
MYCKKCGKTYNSYQLYCPQDGYPLQTTGDADKVQSRKSKRCPECRTNSGHEAAMYCTTCGRSLDTYERAGSAPQTSFNPTLGRKVLPGLLVSTGLLFVISQFIVFYVYRVTQSVGYLQVQLPVDRPVLESLNFLDVSMFANLTGISLILENDDFMQHISYFSTGLGFMAVIAVIALVTGGYVIKHWHHEVTAWKAAVVFAVGYAALLGVISQSSGISHVTGNSHYETSLTFYSTNALINGVILGFIFSYAGMGLWEMRHRKPRLSDGERGIRYGIFTAMAAYVLMLLVTALLHTQYNPQLETDGSSSSGMGSSVYNNMSFIGKMAGLAIQLATGNTIIIKRPGPAPKTYSFLSDVSEEDKSAIGFVIPPDFFASSHVFVMMVLAVFFIAAGFWLAKGHNGSLRLVLVYTFVVAGIMTFFAFYTSMNQVFQSGETFRRFLGDESVFMGFRLLRTCIISLLYVGVTASIGVLIRKLIEKKGGVR